MKKINVLVFPAGEVNSVELHDAMCANVNIKIFGASSTDRHGSFIFENYFCGLPNISEPYFITEFNKLIGDWEINVVFPTHDTVALFLAEKSDVINSKIIVSDENTSRILRDKGKTYKHFSEADFAPIVYSDFEQLPVFIKPKVSQGSVGARLITDKTDAPTSIDEYVICEYLPGEEFTVDCFTDNKGELRYISPRSRDRVSNGVCVRGTSREITTEIETIAKTINSSLHFLGLWWFQIKKDNNGKFKLLEISTRIAGTMVLTRARGVNLPLLSVYTALDREVEIQPNSYEVMTDRILTSKFNINYDYFAVYIDYDDTIIVNNKVNLTAIRYLHQCKNKGIDIFLITKHAFDIHESLQKHYICIGMFTDIIVLKPEHKKSDFINASGSIFIDNSFAERSDVYKNIGIPVFDVDGIEFLIDWRS